MKKRISGIAFAIAVLVIRAAAQDSASNNASVVRTNVSLTLDALVAEALERNPELRFYEAEVSAAKAGRRSAGLWANPELSTSVGQKTVRGGGLRDEGVAWSVSVAQPFEWPGRIPLRKAIANRDVELAEVGLERFRSAIAGKLRSATYGLFAAQQKAGAMREVADRFQALREVLVQRDPAGLTPLLEARVIEANEVTIQRKTSEAELEAQAGLIELNHLRGLAPTTHVSVASARLTFQPVGDLNVLLALARTNNFELRQRTVELAQQGFRVALSKNERFPSISVGPGISEERAGDRERIIGVGISMPLPLWNRNAANIEIARAREMQAETALYITRREVERQVTESVLRYERKLREMSRWRPDSIEHFRQAADLADRHYRLGSVPLATYVELQEKYLEAVESLLDTKKNALDAAQQIEVLTGVTLPISTANAGLKP